MGSIGNQLFQVAALISYAKDNNLIPKIPNIDGYYEYSYGRFVDYLPNGIDLGLDRLSQDDTLTSEIEEKIFHYSKLDVVPNSSISGYFQSEKHFIHNSNLIRQTFLNFKPEIQRQITSIASQLPFNKELTAIHVRRGDYVNKQEFHTLLGMEYYNSAKQIINNGNQEFLVFSDDIPWCKENFDDSHYIIDSGNPFVDLGVMACCDNFIIANSSFSWWGAWLSTNECKKVVAPKKWFGPRNSNISTKDLIPNQWILI